MSKFSEYLRQMIKKSGESVSAVSRSIGAERTSKLQPPVQLVVYY